MAYVSSLTLNVILNGEENLSTRDNIIFHEAVSNYISNSNRFLICFTCKCISVYYDGIHCFVIYPK